MPSIEKIRTRIAADPGLPERVSQGLAELHVVADESLALPVTISLHPDLGARPIDLRDPDDVGFLAQHILDKDHCALFLDGREDFQSGDEVLAYFTEKMEKMLGGNYWIMLVWGRDEHGQPTRVGSIEVHSIDPEKKTATIGVWTAPAYQNRGIATQTTELAKQVGFQEFGLEEIFFELASDNRASARVAEKAGASEMHRETLGPETYAYLGPTIAGQTVVEEQHVFRPTDLYGHAKPSYPSRISS